MVHVQVLLEFQYTEPNGKDQGINVRKKAQTLIALLKDREKIREAREKAAANRNKSVSLVEPTLVEELKRGEGLGDEALRHG